MLPPSSKPVCLTPPAAPPRSFYFKITLHHGPHSFSQCKVTYFNVTDPLGRVPTSFTKVPQNVALNLAAVKEARDEINLTDHSVDDYVIKTLANKMKYYNQTYSKEEIEFQKAVRNTFSFRLGTSDSEPVLSDDPFVEIGNYAIPPKENTFVGRGVVVVDASPEQIAAWEMASSGRTRLKFDSRNNNLGRNVKNLSEHSHLTHDMYLADGKYYDRLLRTEWKRESDESVEVLAGSVRHANFKESTLFARVHSTTLMRCTKLAPIHAVLQTRVEYLVEEKLVGHQANSMTTRASERLMHLSRMREYFSQSLLVEEAKDVIMNELVSSTSGASSPEEDGLVASGLTELGDYEMTHPQPAGASSFTYKTFNLKASFKSAGIAWGKVETEVRAPPPQVLAYLWNVAGRCRWNKCDTARVVLQEVSPSYQIVYQAQKSFKLNRISYGARDFVYNMVWKKVENNTLVVTGVPYEHEDRPVREDMTRTPFRFTAVIVKSREGNSRVTYFANLDFGGNLLGRAGVAVKAVVVRKLKLVGQMKDHFQGMRGLKSYDREDGRSMGYRLMSSTLARPGLGEEAKRKRERVKEVVESHQGMRELSKQYPWLVHLLEEAVLGVLVINRPISSPLVRITTKEATTIGRNITPALKARKTAEAGLYQWKMQNPAMVELFDDYPWFESLLTVVASEVIKVAPWGLFWRVFIGAALSLVDIISDIVMINLFFNTPGQEAFAYATLAMVCMNMLIQLTVVFVQYRGARKIVIFLECISVILAIKPALSAYHVASGRKRSRFHKFDSFVELNLVKGAEVLTESIPAGVVQAYAIIGGGENSEIALVSIVISAIAAGFTCTVVSHDIDTSPSSRRKNPDFYGYVPDAAGTRTVNFVSNWIICTCQLLARSLLTAMLCLVKMDWFGIFVAADFGLFFLYKAVVQKELRHRINVQNSALSMIMSFLVRILVKTLTDFTAIVHFRQPAEMSGFYWSLNLLMTQGFMFGACFLYFEYGEGGEGVFSRKTVYGSAAGLSVIFLASLVAFGWSMDKKYRKTFYSSTTGAHAVFAEFHNAVTYLDKLSVVRQHRMYYEKLGPEIRDLLQHRWSNIKKEHWFEDVVVDVPLDFIPKDKQTEIIKIRAKAGIGSGRNNGLLGGPRRLSPFGRTSTLFSNSLKVSNYDGGQSGRNSSVFGRIMGKRISTDGGAQADMDSVRNGQFELLGQRSGHVSGREKSSAGGKYEVTGATLNGGGKAVFTAPSGGGRAILSQMSSETLKKELGWGSDGEEEDTVARAEGGKRWHEFDSCERRGDADADDTTGGRSEESQVSSDTAGTELTEEPSAMGALGGVEKARVKREARRSRGSSGLKMVRRKSEITANLVAEVGMEIDRVESANFSAPMRRRSSLNLSGLGLMLGSGGEGGGEGGEGGQELLVDTPKNLQRRGSIGF